MLPGPPLPILGSRGDPLVMGAIEPGLLTDPMLPFKFDAGSPACIGPDILLRVLLLLLLPFSSCSDTLRSFEAELNTSSLSVVAWELVSKFSKLVITAAFPVNWLISLLSTGEVELSEEEE